MRVQAVTVSMLGGDWPRLAAASQSTEARLATMSPAAVSSRLVESAFRAIPKQGVKTHE
jgi:hypothetical protein